MKSSIKTSTFNLLAEMFSPLLKTLREDSGVQKSSYWILQPQDSLTASIEKMQ